MTDVRLLPYVIGYVLRENIDSKASKEVLLCFRSHTGYGDNHYALLGGKLDKDESMINALIREMYEEVGIVISAQDLMFSHVIHFEGATVPCIALVFTVKVWQGEPYNKEPHKHDHIAWFGVNNLPANLLPRHARIIEHIKRGTLYADEGY